MQTRSTEHEYSLSQCDLVIVPGTRLQVPYAPANHNQGDEHGMLAGNFRVLGAVARHLIELRQLGELGHMNDPDIVPTPIMFTGGLTKPVNSEYVAGMPTEATTFKIAFQKTFELVCELRPDIDEISESVGRPELLTETGSSTTSNGLKAAITIARSRNVRRLEVLTGLYHEPRATMKTEELLTAEPENTMEVKCTIAEDFAEHVFGQAFKNMKLKAYNSRLGNDRLWYESLGMAAHFDGQYNNPRWSSEHRFTRSTQVGHALLMFICTRQIMRQAGYRPGREGDYVRAMEQLLQ